MRLKLRACETNWAKITSTEKNSSTDRMIEVIIQPRPLRGLGVGGGVMTGGGGGEAGGGGGDDIWGGTPGDSKGGVSIAPPN